MPVYPCYGHAIHDLVYQEQTSGHGWSSARSDEPLESEGEESIGWDYAWECEEGWTEDGVGEEEDENQVGYTRCWYYGQRPDPVERSAFLRASLAVQKHPFYFGESTVRLDRLLWHRRYKAFDKAGMHDILVEAGGGQTRVEAKQEAECPTPIVSRAHQDFLQTFRSLFLPSLLKDHALPLPCVLVELVLQYLQSDPGAMIKSGSSDTLLPLSTRRSNHFRFVFGLGILSPSAPLRSLPPRALEEKWAQRSRAERRREEDRWVQVLEGWKRKSRRRRTRKKSSTSCSPPSSLSITQALQP